MYNGVQFTLLPHQFVPSGHSFDRVCREFGVEATVQCYHYESTAQLNKHLQAFLLAYNHAKRLKRLRGLTPYEFVCAQWQKNPIIFTCDPTLLGTIHLEGGG